MCVVAHHRPSPLSVRCLVLAVLVVLCASVADAADRRFYLSAKWGTTDVDGRLDDTFDQILDGDEDSSGFEVGYRFMKYLGVQAGYHDFGSVPGFGPPCGPGDEVCPLALVIPTVADTTAYSLSVVPRLPLLGTLSLFGKVGLARWESDLRAAFGDGTGLGSFSEEDVIYGAGLRAGLLGPLSVYAEYEKIGDVIETISLGATLTF
ncbi:MAG TPA: outer membrane beta-barrel protein [Thermoanaerobaculia bacterium]|nr:outer membrane beta-barrel protein [Thermoanaerobaculia bacterium]